MATKSLSKSQKAALKKIDAEIARQGERERYEKAFKAHTSSPADLGKKKALIEAAEAAIKAGCKKSEIKIPRSALGV